MEHETSSLSRQIKKTITLRIILCAVFLFLTLLATFYYYYRMSIHQVNTKLINIDKNLNSYVVSQMLIGDRYAIYLKFKEVAANDNVNIVWHKKGSVPRPGLRFNGLFSWTYSVLVKSIDNQVFGTYVISGTLLNNPDFVATLYIMASLLIVFALLTIFILYPIGSYIPRNIIINPVLDLIDLLSKRTPGSSIRISGPKEIQILKQNLIQLLAMEKETLKKESSFQLARQVAHDMRSPLAAINTAVSGMPDVPEKSRVMIKKASGRLNDLANNLLLYDKNDVDAGEALTGLKETSSELLHIVIDNILSEKRYEYSGRKIAFLFEMKGNPSLGFSNINPVTFGRIISNLINNAVEALDSPGTVKVVIEVLTDVLEIVIDDNGCGIPDELLSKVCSNGFSYGKQTGAGLGLSYARAALEKMDGVLMIRSQLGVGTQVKITLPRSNQPPWFCDKIQIPSHSSVVVLDDDDSIHDVWSEKLSHVPGVTFFNFYNTSELSIFLQDSNLKIDLYLIDYEILGSDKNGMDSINEIQDKDNVLLVTTCHDNAAVRQECVELGVKIIPKSCVCYIPVKVTPKPETIKPVVFIDDDELMRDVWQVAATKSGIDLRVFSSVDAFNKAISLFDVTTVIYIDSCLSCGSKGEDFAKSLYDQGFRQLFLSTGYPDSQFKQMPWLKGVLGKEPPF